MKVKIITDSISDINQEVAMQHDIDVLPIHVTLGDQMYIDTVGIDSRGVAQWIGDNEQTPKFRGISSEGYQKAFQKYADEGRDIVVISVGNDTLSNYDSACHASLAFTNINIQVIDSHNLEGGLAALVLYAADMSEQGESANSIIIQLERAIDRACQNTLVDSVQFLRYTGLIPTILNISQSRLKMKYHLIPKKDRNFSINALSSSNTKSVEKFCKNVFKNLSKMDKQRVILINAVEEHEYFSYIHKYIMDLEYFDEIVVLEGNAHYTSITGVKGVCVAHMLY